MKRDAEKQITLEKKIEEHTREMEQQRASIDEHNKQYYELTKAKDQCQATRKEQFVHQPVFSHLRNFNEIQIKSIILQVSSGERVTTKLIRTERRFSKSRSKFTIYGR